MSLGLGTSHLILILHILYVDLLWAYSCTKYYLLLDFFFFLKFLKPEHLFSD